MFGWFRRYVRKVAFFGFEVELQPPTESGADKPVPAGGPSPEPAPMPYRLTGG